MARGDAERIREYLVQLVDEARSEGRTEISVRAGDVRSALGVDDANVSQVLKGRKFPAQASVRHLTDRMTGPPSGAGGNLTCHFEIMAPGSVALAPVRRAGRRAARGRRAAAPATPQRASGAPGDDVRERLVRLEALVESLVRESGDARADIRSLHSRIDSLRDSK